MINDLCDRKVMSCFNLRRFMIVFILYSCISSNLAQTIQQIVEPQDKIKIMKEISSLFKDRYVYPDLGRKYAKDILSMIQSDRYNAISDVKEFAEKVTIDLQKLTHDKHVTFRLVESSNLGEEKRGSLHHPVRLSRLIQKENLGFSRFDWIEGNIGYLDIRRFNPPSIAKDMVIAAMNFVSGAGAIIIDLRENQGGSTDGLPFLSSYFFEYPTQLNSDYFREYDITKESWTVKEIVGKRLTDIPLFILTSDKTFSAAESFAYDMKVRSRAVIIGDSTKGGAHSVDLFKIEDRFEIYISTARSFSPITGSNWEGTGVIPDLLVPAETALDTAIVLAKEAAHEYLKIKDSELKKAVHKMQWQLDRADSLYQMNQDELASTVLDSVFQTGSEANLIDEFFVQVLFYDYWSRQNDKMLSGILKKNIDLFPDSPDAYESLAWYYVENGKNDLAIQYFERVLELDQNHSLSIEMLRKLKKQ